MYRWLAAVLFVGFVSGLWYPPSELPAPLVLQQPSTYYCLLVPLCHLLPSPSSSPSLALSPSLLPPSLSYTHSPSHSLSHSLPLSQHARSATTTGGRERREGGEVRTGPLQQSSSLHCSGVQSQVAGARTARVSGAGIAQLCAGCMAVVSTNLPRPATDEQWQPAHPNTPTPPTYTRPFPHRLLPLPCSHHHLPVQDETPLCCCASHRQGGSDGSDRGSDTSQRLPS